MNSFCHTKGSLRLLAFNRNIDLKKISDKSLVFYAKYVCNKVRVEREKQQRNDLEIVDFVFFN